MLSLWRLTLLCGLFISPSYCLLDSQSPALGSVQSVVNQETQVVTDKLQDVGQDLKKELEKLKLSPSSLLGNLLGDIGKLVDSTVNALISKLEEIFQVQVLNSQVLKISVELGSDGKSVNLRVPVSVTIALKLNPFSSELVRVKVDVDVLAQVSIDTEDGVSTLVLGDCSSDSSTVSLSLLDNLSGLQKALFRVVEGLLNKLLPIIVQQQVCPLIRNLANLLDVSQVQDVINNLATNTNVDLPLSLR